VAALFDRQNHIGCKTVAKDLTNLSEAGLDIFTVGGSNFVVPARVFHIHEAPLRDEVLCGAVFSCELLALSKTFAIPAKG
jgi:hypothetical protein